MAVFLACWPGLYASRVRAEPASGARWLPSFSAGCCLILWGPVHRHAPPSCQPVSVRALLQLSVGSGVRARVSGALWAPSPTWSRFAATTRPPSHTSLSLACANGRWGRTSSSLTRVSSSRATDRLAHVLGMAFLPTLLQGSPGFTSMCIEGGALQALLGVSACGCVLVASASVITLPPPPGDAGHVPSGPLVLQMTSCHWPHLR